MLYKNVMNGMEIVITDSSRRNLDDKEERTVNESIRILKSEVVHLF